MDKNNNNNLPAKLHGVSEAAFDFDAPGPQNNAQKSKNNRKLNLSKVGFSKNDET